VSCDLEFTPSHSAVVRTLNVTRCYMALPERHNHHVLLEQCQTPTA
jgi:hypothetical protein